MQKAWIGSTVGVLAFAMTAAIGCGSSGGGGGLLGAAGSGAGGHAGSTGAAGTTGAGGSTGAAGSTGAGASCGGLEPCGGSIAGTWNVTSSCVNSAALAASIQQGLSCPQATASVTSLSNSGTLQFNADMTYTITAFAQSLTLHASIPTSCLAGMTCAQYQTSLQQSTPGATCTGSTTCVCDLPNSTSDTESGTYTISGTSVVTTSSVQGTSTVPYCVQGSTIHFIQLDTTMNMGPMGQATIDQDVMAQKQ
jgi:hypothetical protein